MARNDGKYFKVKRIVVLRIRNTYYIIYKSYYIMPIKKDFNIFNSSSRLYLRLIFYFIYTLIENGNLLHIKGTRSKDYVL